MTNYLLPLGLIFVLLLQVSVTTIPLVLLFLIVWYCVSQSERVFLAAAISGIFLDVSLVYPVGLTSLFFLFVLFLVFLYQRKFELLSAHFIFFEYFCFYCFLYSAFSTAVRMGYCFYCRNRRCRCFLWIAAFLVS